MERKRWFNIVLFSIYFFLFHLLQSVNARKNILSASNHTDYVLYGEKATLTCNVGLKRVETESVEWSLNDEIFYTWRHDTKSELPEGIFKGRIDTKTYRAFQISIKNVVIQMTGSYECVATSKAGGEKQNNSFYMVVIKDSCKEDNWKMTLAPETCTQTINFECKSFYPKPTIECSLYDRDKRDSVIQIPMDSTRKNRDQMFDISTSRQYNVKDYQESKDLILRCDLSVKNTSWKFRIEKEMFGERGCQLPHPLVEDGSMNRSSIVKTCWETPASGSKISYRCNQNEKETTIQCFNGSWIDESSNDTVPESYCGGGSTKPMLTELSFLLATTVMFFYY